MNRKILAKSKYWQKDIHGKISEMKIRPQSYRSASTEGLSRMAAPGPGKDSGQHLQWGHSFADLGKEVTHQHKGEVVGSESPVRVENQEYLLPTSIHSNSKGKSDARSKESWLGYVG